MAMNIGHVYVFFLILHNLLLTTNIEKKFNPLKRCEDEQCNTPIYRGRMISDFTGPDCRFLSVKQGQTVDVYFRLLGRTTEIWAGNVSIRS
ncbi:hypothetical protein UPYG_G00057740 [Umbra pygmaea]|uniref:SH3 domain-containing protein n=1 Tax=Umbra pygmaea TaxID=75934 RepID=A0ABD0XQK0_UMBPY